MGGGVSTIDDLRASLEMAAANQPDPATVAKNKETTATDLWSVTPVVGNAMSATDAIDAYRAAADALKGGRYKDAAKSGTMAAVNTVGAVTGLPFGRGAKAAAKGGKDRLNVFVPVEEGKLSERARELREGGASNEAVHKTTGLVFGPDGTMRRRVPDNVMDIDMSFQPGDITTLGNLTSHPTLFREFPDMQNRIVHVTDKLDPYHAERGVPRGISRTDPETGNYEFSIKGMDPYADMAKLMQYDINDRVGFASAGRHRFDDQLADINTAQLRAIASGGDREAIQAYAEALERVKAGLGHGDRQTRNKDLSRKLTDLDAGSTDAKIVRGEANLTGKIGHYPYAANAPWIKGYWTPPGFGNLTVLPPKGATRDDIAQFLEDWKRYGSGAGD